ncbi:hypothetical protein Tco_0071325 [Tanacetum coccineum]
MDSGCSKHIKENLEEVVDDDDDMIDNVDHDDQPLIGKKKSGSSETRNEKMQTPIPIPPKSLRVNLSSNKEPLLEFTDSHVTTSKVFCKSDLPAILRQINKALYEVVPRIIHATSFLEDDLEELLKRWIDEVCVKRDDDKFYTFIELDFKYLNKNDIEDERVHDFQLGIESYQMKINLTAPTITFLGIEKAPLYLIIGIPFVGIDYANSKMEKQAMDIEEL